MKQRFLNQEQEKLRANWLEMRSTFEFHPESLPSILVFECLPLIGQFRPRGFKNRTLRQCTVIGSCYGYVFENVNLQAFYGEIILSLGVKI